MEIRWEYFPMPPGIDFEINKPASFVTGVLPTRGRIRQMQYSRLNRLPHAAASGFPGSS
jgi:hypothetical protein